MEKRYTLFLPVAQSMGIEIFAPENGFISFFNSPYYSHMNVLAVDIYPNTDKLNYYAPSPVEGIISNVYEFKSSRHRSFDTPTTEKMVLISSPRRPNLRVRILHVDCRLKVGTRVVVGEPLGFLERSGYFNFWTERHMHVEVRGKHEPLRAKGAFPMDPINLGKEIERNVKNKISVMRIEAVGKKYLIAETSDVVIRSGGFWGLGCKINHQLGILDCGLPHYGYGGVHIIEPALINVGDPVSLAGIYIGSVTHVYRKFALFRCKPLEVHINDVAFRGFSLYLWLKKNKKVKIIPNKPIKNPIMHKPSNKELILSLIPK